MGVLPTMSRNVSPEAKRRLSKSVDLANGNAEGKQEECVPSSHAMEQEQPAVTEVWTCTVCIT